LASEIAKLRKALGDDSKTPKYLLSDSTEFDSALDSSSHEHLATNAVVFQRQVEGKSWKMRNQIVSEYSENRANIYVMEFR